MSCFSNVVQRLPNEFHLLATYVVSRTDVCECGLRFFVSLRGLKQQRVLFGLALL